MPGKHSQQNTIFPKFTIDCIVVKARTGGRTVPGCNLPRCDPGGLCGLQGLSFKFYLTALQRRIYPERRRIALYCYNNLNTPTMGRDVAIISNHGIDTKSGDRKIAEQLAQAWNANISFAYMDTWTAPSNIFKGTFDIYELFRIDIGAQRTIQLQDELYCDRVHKPEEYEGKMDLSAYEIDDYNKEYPEKGDLGVTAWWPGNYYIGRWWNFIRNFTEEYADDYNYINSFREEVRYNVTCVGGTQAMYFDDQSSESVRCIGETPEEVTILWPELLDKVRDEKGVKFINVSEWMKTEPKQFLIGHTDYVFFDDFADLLDDRK